MTPTPPQKGSAPELTLVVGATGMLGGQIVRLLSESGKKVRAIVRPDAPGEKRAALASLPIEIVSADLRDPRSIRAACEGATSIVSTATAILSRDPTNSIAAVDRDGKLGLVGAATEAGVERFVFISFPPNPLSYAFQDAKRAAEQRLVESGLAYTILQACAFMEVWLSPMLGFNPREGKARIFGDGNQRVSWISVRDVARFACAASEGGAFTRQVLPIGGPDALSPLEVVRLAEELAHRPGSVACEMVPEQALLGMFQGAGNPTEQAMAASTLTTARGQTVESRKAQELLPGRMVTVRDFLLQGKPF